MGSTIVRLPADSVGSSETRSGTGKAKTIVWRCVVQAAAEACCETRPNRPKARSGSSTQEAGGHEPTQLRMGSVPALHGPTNRRTKPGTKH